MKNRLIKNKNKNTIVLSYIIVFFCVLIASLLLLCSYGSYISNNGVELINQKIDKVLYQLFTDLITDDVIKNENILIINKNSNGEILSVNYDIELTYKMLTKISNIIKKGIEDLENGNIDVKTYDKYLMSNKNGLILNIPFFLSSKNIFINNLGPNIPVIINFNETLLTNIKTKVTNYGMNNALLEVYITIEMEKLIITPINKDNNKFNYNILISAVVINGRVPDYYGGIITTDRTLLDIPMD